MCVSKWISAMYSRPVNYADDGMVITWFLPHVDFHAIGLALMRRLMVLKQFLSGHDMSIARYDGNQLCSLDIGKRSSTVTSSDWGSRTWPLPISTYLRRALDILASPLPLIGLPRPYHQTAIIWPLGDNVCSHASAQICNGWLYSTLGYDDMWKLLWFWRITIANLV